MKPTPLNKGNVTVPTIIGWGISIAIASIGFTMTQIAKVSDAQTDTVQRVSVVETQSKQYEKDITEINKKLDILITKTKQ